VFDECKSLTSITLPEGVTNTGAFAFSNCTSLKSVSLPSTLTTLGQDAFYGCTALKTLWLPDMVAPMGNSFVQGCTSLAALRIPESWGSADAWRFSSTLPSTAMLFSTDSAYIKTWAKTNNRAWANEKYFPDEDVLAFGTCGESAMWQVSSDDVLTISGTGAIADYSYVSSTPWSSYRRNLKAVVVEEGITETGSYCFAGGYNDDPLTSISLPNTLEVIGDYTFYNDRITSIELPDSVKTIEHDAFYGCSMLQTVKLPKNLEFIGASAFSWCTALQSVDMPDTVTAIDSYAYCATMSLTSMKLSASLKELPYGVLASTGLKTLVLPDGLETICNIAFKDSDIQNLTIPLSVSTIESSAFNNCPDLIITCHEDSYTAEYAESKQIPTSIIAHSIQIYPAVPAACTETGLTEGSWCTVCKKTLMEQEVVPANGHSYGKPVFTWAEDGSACSAAFTCTACQDVQVAEVSVTSVVIAQPDCTTDGQTTYTATTVFGIEEPQTYTDQLTLADIPSPGHTEETIAGFAPTCTEPGVLDCIFCTTCGVELQTADEIPAPGHTEESYANVPPTCTEPGQSGGKWCTVCKAETEAPTIEPSTGHEEYESIPALDPTCTEPGHTAEIRCRICMAMITASEELGADGHDDQFLVDQDPTCTESGWTGGSTCRVCGVTTSNPIEVPSLGHVPVTDPAVPSTDYASGLTEGSHCGRCSAVLTAQEVIPANFTWSGTTVTDYNGTQTVVTIPAEATALGDTLFKNNTHITSVYVPDSVQSLGTYTFYSCTQLKTLRLPSNLTSIGSQTFYGVNAKIEVPYSSATAVALSYRRVPFMMGDFSVYYRASSATAMPTQAYIARWYGEGDHVLLPELIGTAEVTQLLNDAFKNCPDVRSVWMPDSISFISTGAFTGCSEELVIRSSATAYARTWAQENGYTWEHDIHTAIVIPGVEPTCTESGLTEGERCSACNEVLVAQTLVDALGHTEVIDAAIAPNCTETGLTEGKHCSVCKDVLVEQTVVDALGHTEVIDAAIAPNCTETGLTEGKHCSVCNEVLVAQTVVTANGHSVRFEQDVYEVRAGEEIELISTACVCGEKVELKVHVPSELMLISMSNGTIIVSGSTPGVAELTIEVADEVGNRAICQIVVHAANQMVYPAALTAIEAEAFSNLPIKECVLNDKVERIGVRAFAGCANLVLINLPDGVEIAEDAFSGCDRLTILCTEGSKGHVYAVAHEIPYLILPSSLIEEK